MTELDDLRRIAYGRTSSPAEEAAAAGARATLAAHEGRVTAGASAARVAMGASAAPRDVQPQAPTDEPFPVIDPSEEPAYPSRLAATWRVWAGPALAAFVVGVVLSVASGVFMLNAFNSGGSSQVVPGVSDVPGDLDAANLLLASPQGPDDIFASTDPEFVQESKHLLRATPTESIYAARSVDDAICMILVGIGGMSGATCAPEAVFADRGLMTAVAGAGTNVELRWNGTSLTEVRPTP
jgi:hypothetical protein